MSSRVLLPESLCSWVDEHLPTLRSAEGVRFKTCERIPFWWIPGNRHVEGVTLWNTVYLTENHCPIDLFDRRTVELIFHELIHVEQFRRNTISFPFKYLLGHIRYGYWMNPAEVEARSRAARLTKIYFEQTKDEGACGIYSPR